MTYYHYTAAGRYRRRACGTGACRSLILFLLLAILAAGVSSCIEDSVSTSPADQPVFSTDTLDLGTVFTGTPTATQSFKVYNPHGKVMSISSVAFRDNSSHTFRINVDGQSGNSFGNVEIRPNDSIFVLVEATVPVNGTWADTRVSEVIDFVTNGVTTSVVVSATGRDIERIYGTVIERDTVWYGDRPRQIFDSLIVAPGATLTLKEGTVLHFHDKSLMRVDGTLYAEGSPARPVEMCGDRTGNVVADISFDIMASQWEGLIFSPSSGRSRMSHTVVRNTVSGVLVDSLAGSSASDAPALELVNCRIRNSAGYALEVRHADLHATGCEIADAAYGALRLTGGKHRISHCTIANYYLFAALRGAALQLSHLTSDDASDTGWQAPLLQADISNTIIYGNGQDVSPTDLTGSAAYLRHCLLKSNGSDDDNFVDCAWDTDPMYYTVREEYVFDYRLREGSPAAGTADPAYTPAGWTADFFGVSRNTPPDMGAYTYVVPDQPQP